MLNLTCSKKNLMTLCAILQSESEQLIQSVLTSIRVKCIVFATEGVVLLNVVLIFVHGLNPSSQHYHIQLYILIHLSNVESKTQAIVGK